MPRSRWVLLDLFPQAADVDRERVVVHEMPRPVPECLEDHTAGDDKPGVSYQHTEKPVFGGSEGQRFPAKEDPAGEQVNGHIAGDKKGRIGDGSSLCRRNIGRGGDGASGDGF